MVPDRERKKNERALKRYVRNTIIMKKQSKGDDR